MTLSAIELMDLSDKLDALMSKRRPRVAWSCLDISDEIDQIMQQMGYGASGGGMARKKQPSEHDGVPKWLLISWLINSPIRAPMHYRYLAGLESICCTYIDWTRLNAHGGMDSRNIKEAA
ncbi:Uncharacterised protein [Escherichia coli]|nr:Uncharacterised protein [Escherichia coli]